MLPKVTAVGNVGKDAMLKFTPNGTAKAEWSMACSEKYGERESTEWVNCVLWGKRAEALAEHITKGKGLVVFGKMLTRNWDDDQGQKHYRTEVTVEDVQFMSGNPQPRERQQQGDEYDDLPF